MQCRFNVITRLQAVVNKYNTSAASYRGTEWLNCWLYSFNNALVISSIGMAAYSCTYCGSASSRLKPAFFVKKGCITSGVASPNCRICKRSICRRRGWYTRLGGGPVDGAGALGLGGGCALLEVVVARSKGEVAEPCDGIASSMGGPSLSLLLGIADIESVVL